MEAWKIIYVGIMQDGRHKYLPQCNIAGSVTFLWKVLLKFLLPYHFQV